MNQIALAFRCFFALLFHGELSNELINDLGLARKGSAAAKSAQPKGQQSGKPQQPAAAPPPAVNTSDGALQLLAVLQRDGRILDFFMEDIGAYADDQVGAAARSMHTPCREAINRYFTLQPVIDGVEGTFAKPASNDPAMVKWMGNVPAGAPSGGILRHRGWKVSEVKLPPLNAKQKLNILAPAEIEVE